MVISSRPRKTGHGFQIIKNDNVKRIPIAFDLASLSLMCSYIVSENRNIKKAHYINLRNLISLLDMSKYINDEEKYKRITFIQRGLEARLVRGLTDPLTILKYINGGILDYDLIDSNELKSLSNNEIEWVNETVSSSMKVSFMYQECDTMIDLWTRFKSADYKSISSIASEIETATANLHTLFRKAKIENSSDVTFSLSGDLFSSTIADTYNEVTSKYRKLKTGMQGFNQFIGGGFENTRVYLFLGITGVGKSMTLIDIAYQLKKYNKNYKPKDPTKRPCIVYLTQENTVTETIQRLFKISTGEELDKQTSPEEIERKLRTEGELYISDESPIDIIIKFKPNRSVDTSYLYTLVEDLEDEGYETICLIQDHAKRIRSTDGNPDIRLELGDVINEFRTFAMLKDISLITDSHLNRDGARVIDENSGKSKADLTRLLGKSNIGESLLMLDNVDFAGIINTEYDKDGHKYMAFKQIKTRIETFRDFILQPYMENNSIKLIEDFYSPVPVFKDTLYEAPTMSTGTTTTTQNVRSANYNTSAITLDDNEDTIYEFATRYSSMKTISDTTEKRESEPYKPTGLQLIEPYSIAS